MDKILQGRLSSQTQVCRAICSCFNSVGKEMSDCTSSKEVRGDVSPNREQSIETELSSRYKPSSFKNSVLETTDTARMKDGI